MIAMLSSNNSPAAERKLSAMNEDNAATIPRRNPSSLIPGSTPVAMDKVVSRVVTPSLTTPSAFTTSPKKRKVRTVMRSSKKRKVRRVRSALFTSKVSSEDDTVVEVAEPKAKRKLAFGKTDATEHITCQKNVEEVYKTVNKLSGSLGGNASGGAIYGELNKGSMQRMVNLMKEHTGFCRESRFIDVGSGLGKPNLHCAQDPAVEFSYGIEMVRSRWMLGMAHLRAMVNAAHAQSQSGQDLLPEEQIGHRCFFAYGNIKQAETFDPFTHVYMFSIG
jgi:hypothetical protein